MFGANICFSREMLEEFAYWHNLDSMLESGVYDLVCYLCLHQALVMVSGLVELGNHPNCDLSTVGNIHCWQG